MFNVVVVWDCARSRVVGVCTMSASGVCDGRRVLQARVAVAGTCKACRQAYGSLDAVVAYLMAKVSRSRCPGPQAVQPQGCTTALAALH